MRVVLDTNVLISALLFGGRLHFIVELLQHGELTPCFSYRTWRELERTLNYPHLASALKKQGVIKEQILELLEVNSLLFPDITSPLAVPHDPADEAILACAVAATAEAVVTGDKHLLLLRDFFTVPIFSPAEFKQWLAQH